jgi:hypothetical protein
VREVSKDESRGADVIGAVLAFRGIAALVALAAASLVAWWMPLEPRKGVHYLLEAFAMD